MVLGLRYFVNTYGAMDMLFDISVEGMGTGRVGTGRLTTGDSSGVLWAVNVVSGILDLLMALSM